MNANIYQAKKLIKMELNMEAISDLQAMINTWKKKFAEKIITQQDLNWLNSMKKDDREKILEAIPEAEDVFCELCIDEDINNNYFFTTSSEE
jgi:hypothetical protein